MRIIVVPSDFNGADLSGRASIIIQPIDPMTAGGG
jgi:hypothetical protein